MKSAAAKIAWKIIMVPLVMIFAVTVLAWFLTWSLFELFLVPYRLLHRSGGTRTD